VKVAKLALVIVGLFLTFVIKTKSRWLFALSLIVILLSGFFILTNHQGGALEFSLASFFLLLMALFRYLVEIKTDEK